MEETVRDKALEENRQNPLGNLPFFLDIPLRFVVVAGGARISLEKLKKLRRGVVIPLDRKCDEPFDLNVNRVRFARCEMVTEKNNLKARILEIV